MQMNSEIVRQVLHNQTHAIGSTEAWNGAPCILMTIQLAHIENAAKAKSLSLSVKEATADWRFAVIC